MNLKDLNIQKSYINRGENNLVDALINPALEVSVSYKRSVGFFSSSVFSMIINALPEFIKNQGKIQLIVSPLLSDEDIIAIKQGYQKRDIVEKAFLNNIELETDLMSDEDLNVLSALIANKILDIKVVAVKNHTGIYHDKLGIFTDAHGNSIVFYGSANSSKNAYQNNYEKIRTITSWDLSNADAVKDEIHEFDSLWDNHNEYIETYSFMDSLEKRIVKIISNRQQAKKANGPITLYQYQKEAIQAWVGNDYHGFFVMATGTGKTWTAIYASKELVERHPSLVVIAAPYKHLVKQWAEDVKKVYPNATIILVSSENAHWYLDAKRAVLAQKYDHEKQVILISTIKSFYSTKFNDILELSSQSKLLVVDEAHRFTQRPEELNETFDYMLGLSATPVNGKNNAAGEELMQFFGGQVYNLPIEIALEKHFLVPYYYHPIYVYATEEEEEQFAKHTATIASCYHNGIIIDKDKLAVATRARLRVISMAAEKMKRLDELLDKVRIKDHFVVYCGDGKLFESDKGWEIRHIQFVKNHLDKLRLRTSQFTASEDMVRRVELVDMFNNREIDSMVAIRCLDEGINIPSIKSALILSSNDDYREFVQRRGRILRKYPGKKDASIYDVIVLPSMASEKIAIIELRRYYEYARLAINKDELLEKLDEMLDKYHLNKEEIMFFNNDMEAELDE